MQLIESGIILLLTAVIVLFGCKICKLKKFNEDYLSLENTLPLRGTLSIFIVIYHISGHMKHTTLLNAFSQIGYLIVAIFFFLSGYGLYYGYKNKNNYMKGFLLKRLPVVLIPYIIVTAFQGVCLIFMGESIKISDFFASLLGYRMFDETTWYICMLTVLYIVFYLSFRFLSENKSTVVFIILFLLVLTVFMVLPLEAKWTRSIIAFPLGVMWCKYKNKIDNIIRNNYYINLLLSGLAFLITCFVKIAGVYLNSNLIVFLGNALSSITVCILLSIILNKITLKNKVLLWIGTHSLEIYLYHNIILRILGRIQFIHNDTFLYVSTTFLITIIISMIISPINKLLIKACVKPKSQKA